MDYPSFLAKKSQCGANSGFEPLWLPDWLFDFQQFLVEWAIRKGRAAIFADCVAGETVIDGPFGSERIDMLASRGKSPWVWAFDGVNPVPVKASIPWINGIDRIYEYRFESGRTLRATLDHRFLTTTGWKRGRFLVPGERLRVCDVSHHPSNSECILSTQLLNDRSLRRIVPNCSDHCFVCPYPCDEQPLLAEGVCQEYAPSQDGAHAHIPPLCNMGDQGNGSSHIHRCQHSGRPSMNHCGFPAENVVADEVCQLPSFCRTRTAGNNHIFQLTPEDTILGAPIREFRPSEAQQFAVSLSEPSVYSRELDTLVAVQYIRTDVFYDLEVPHFHNYSANGLWSHNCGLGKTPMFLAWAQNVVRHTNGRVIIFAPLAVTHQIVHEGEKFGIEVHRSIDGKPVGKINTANYERMHLFDESDYVGVVCDESQIIKHWSGKTQKQTTRFLSKKSYRLLCTATPSPNDYVEMGTSSEALGALSHSQMLETFFRQMSDDEKKKRAKKTDIIHSKRLSWRVLQSFGQWVLRAHAFDPFWKWVSSWARACRKPSDLGPFDDGKFVLPPLNRFDHTVVPRKPPPGHLFTIPAFGLNQERGERRRTLDERAELVVDLTKDSERAVVWCHLNPEGDRLEKDIPGAVQVKGSQSIDQKEELLLSFLNSESRVLVTKAKIAGLGLNMQHCNHVVTFVDHSYEKFYQSIRRCWRFGQHNPVRLDVISTEGELNVKRNMDRKEKLASQMFDSIIANMNQAQAVNQQNGKQRLEVPPWLQETK